MIIFVQIINGSFLILHDMPVYVTVLDLADTERFNLLFLYFREIKHLGYLYQLGESVQSNRGPDVKVKPADLAGYKSWPRLYP